MKRSTSKAVKAEHGFFPASTENSQKTIATKQRSRKSQIKKNRTNNILRSQCNKNMNC